MTLISDMRGPCPKEFHVPLRSEWSNLIQAGITLGAWTATGGEDLCTYLKLPLAGYRYCGNGNPSAQGETGYYYSSEANESDAYYVEISENSISHNIGIARANALSIRAFRNTPVVPNNGWTALFEGSDGAGIFHSATLGLISISANGQDWITIMDKNLGASETYDSGDTLIEDTCGKYYQWGNNYGFVFLGTISKSSIKVDTTNYGPEHYYSDYKFITSNGDWSSVRNDNIWGGVTQSSHEDYPQYDIDQIRRQFPQEIVRYIDAMIGYRFDDLSGQLATMELSIEGLNGAIDTMEDETLPAVAQAAAAAAEQAFEQMALSAIVAQLTPEIDEYIAEGVIDTRTGEKYKFYVDEQTNIDALVDRDDHTLYIGKEPTT